MGNDGGSIPKRSELVREAAKAPTASQLKEAQSEHQQYSWTTDPLSRKPLARPIVSDAAGVLYNKDSIIEFLLKDDADRAKEEMRKVAGVEGLGTFGERVKGLKDVVEVRFEEAGEGGQRESGRDDGEGMRNGAVRGTGEKWVCPITGRELGPGAKACYIVPCGHAFAGSVVKEVKGSVCLQCNEPYAENDIIPILPTLPTDLARLSLRLKTLKEKGLTHALKKAPGSKKRKKETISTDVAAGTAPTPTDSSTPIPQVPKQQTSSTMKQISSSSPASNGNDNGIKNASTASLTRKVLLEQEERNKRRKMMENDNVKSLFSKSETKPDLKRSADYMTRGFSIGKK